MQTEELETADQFNQCPEDFSVNYNKIRGTSSRSNTAIGNKRQKESEVVRLNEFVARAGALMEVLLDENAQLASAQKAAGQKRNPVEPRCTLVMPEELARIYDGHLVRLGLLYIFDSAPQTKAALSFVLDTTSGREHVAVVYSLSLGGKAVNYCASESEIRSICAPEEYTLLLGTAEGSILVFDLQDYSPETNKQFGGTSTGNLPIPEGGSPELVVKLPTYSTDGLPEPVHLAPVSKIVALYAETGTQVASLDEEGGLALWALIELSDNA